MIFVVVLGGVGLGPMLIPLAGCDNPTEALGPDASLQSPDVTDCGSACDPLDAGSPPDVVEVDAGVEPPVIRFPPTHTGTVVIAQLTHSLDADRKEGLIQFETAEIRGNRASWRHARTATGSSFGRCSVIERERWSLARSRADLGDVRVHLTSLADPSKEEVYTLSFDQNIRDYVVDPIPPANFLLYSDPTQADEYPRTITIEGLGNMITGGSWPNDPNAGELRVPRRLGPSPDTQLDLGSGYAWDLSDPQPLQFAWHPQFYKSGTVLTAMEEGMTVRLRIEGPSYTVECRQDDEIRLSVMLDSRTMERFIKLEGFSDTALPPSPLPLYFERVFAVRIPVRADSEPGGITIHMSARVSDTHVSQISIVP